MFGHPDDHRVEGFVVGAIAGGVTLAVWLAQLCGLEGSSSGCVLGVGTVGLLLGGLIGGGLGAVVGSTFPKERPANPE